MPQRRMPQGETKQTQEQWSETKLNESMNRFINTVLEAHNEGTLGDYVGPNGYGSKTMGNKYLGDIYFNLRRRGIGWGKPLKDKELNLHNSIEEMKQGKVFEQARSTFGEGLVERFEKFLPDPMDKPENVAATALRFKARNKFLQQLEDNPGLRTLFNDLAQRDTARNIPSPKHSYSNQLARYILDSPEYNDYENKVVNAYIKPGSKIDETDFNPFLAFPDKISQFFMNTYGNEYADPFKLVGSQMINRDVVPDEYIEGVDKSESKRRDKYLQMRKKFQERFGRK